MNAGTVQNESNDNELPVWINFHWAKSTVENMLETSQIRRRRMNLTDLSFVKTVFENNVNFQENDSAMCF